MIFWVQNNLMNGGIIVLEELSLYNMKVFCKVVESRNISDAAKKLNISQPAVSTHIRLIEKKMQTNLLERGRTICLTPSGKIFYDYCKNILKITEETEQLLRELYNSKTGRIAVAAYGTLSQILASEVFHRFAIENPGIDLALYTGSPKMICEKILNGEVDFGFVIGEILIPGLESKVIAQDEVVMLVGLNHPLACRETITPHELSRQSFIVKSNELESMDYNKNIISLLRERGITFSQILMEVNDTESIKQVLKKGIGVATLLKQSAKEELENHELHQIKLTEGPIYINICQVYRSDKCITPLFERFLNFTERAINQHLSK